MGDCGGNLLNQENNKMEKEKGHPRNLGIPKKDQVEVKAKRNKGNTKWTKVII